jgi:tetratricopeptide (TPR) repeat protein
MIEVRTAGRRSSALVAVLLVYPLSLAAWRQTAPAGQAPAQSALTASYEHYQAGRYEEAIASAKTALAADPNSADAYNNMAVAYLGLRKYPEAVRAAEEAIRLKPDYQLAKNNLAWIQREQANPTAPPTPADTLLSDSLKHAQAGRFKECVDAARQSARLDPKSSRAFNNAGFCAGSLKLWDEAVKDVREAIRLDPNNQLAKNNLAWIEQQKALAGSKSK